MCVGMKRREVLRQCGAGMTVAGSFALAGCGGNGDGGGGNGNGDGGGSGNGNGGTGDGDNGDGGSNGNGGGDNGESSGTGGDEPTVSATSTPESSDGGSVGRNTVDGLEITGWVVQDVEDQFQVSVTIRNTGDRTTDIFNYEYGLALYGNDGTEISTDGGGSGSTNDTEIAPGQRASINVFQSVDGSPEDVERFEISLSCDGPFVDGVYCSAGPVTTAESGPTNTGDVQGSVGQNDVPQLEFTDWEVQQDDSDDFTVLVTVRNGGEQTTDVFDYDFGMVLYDASGTDITGSSSGSMAVSDTETAPGETTQLNLFQEVNGSPADVATYRLTLGCDDFFSEGAYCE